MVVHAAPSASQTRRSVQLPEAWIQTGRGRAAGGRRAISPQHVDKTVDKGATRAQAANGEEAR
jgi:hypothetical protein